MKSLQRIKETFGSAIRKAKNGKGLGDIGMFSGFGEGTLKKPYKEIN